MNFAVGIRGRGRGLSPFRCRWVDLSAGEQSAAEMPQTIASHFPTFFRYAFFFNIKTFCMKFNSSGRRMLLSPPSYGDIIIEFISC